MQIASRTATGGSTLLDGILAGAAAWIVPFYCTLCGERVGERESETAIPLCARCIQSLVPIGGSRCRKCGRELYSEQELCYACRNGERACEEVYPIFKYAEGPARLLRAYKSGKRDSLVPFWTGLFAGLIDARWPEHVIVPVPPRPEKLKRKEWDQIEAIAKALERRGYPVCRPLERKVDMQQKRLNREMRKENAEKAYTAIPAMAGKVGLSVLLIDDVYTTGATIEACAKALRESGVSSVAALVIAID